MRTLISRSLLLATALFTLQMGHARAPEPIHTKADRTAMERALDRALNKHLAFPVAIKEKTPADVRVSLVVDLEGRVKVLECQGTNARLAEYVVRKLESIDIGENPDGIWKTTHLLIKFRPEQG